MSVYRRRHLSRMLGLIVCLACGNSYAGDKAARVVLHINNPLKMTMLVNNVKNLRSTLGKEASIYVVVNGPAVARFTTLSESSAQLESILVEKAQVGVCSIALKNRKLVRSHLRSGTNYLEDGGVAKLVTLQHQGYAYIKP